MSNRVDNLVRTDLVTAIRRSCPQTNVEIIGVGISVSTLESEAKGQSRRGSTSLGVETTEFASLGKYNQVWDDRDSLFSPVALDTANKADMQVEIVGGTIDAVIDSGTGPASPANIAKTTEVTINNTGWTALPTAV